MARRTYSPLAVARRHPRLFSRMTEAGHLEFWPVAKGLHVVCTMPRRKAGNTVVLIGEIWQ